MNEKKNSFLSHSLCVYLLEFESYTIFSPQKKNK